MWYQSDALSVEQSDKAGLTVKREAHNGEFEYMNAEQQAYFLEKLQDWRGQLMLEATRTMKTMQADTRNFPDDAERASQEETLGIELRTRDRERKLIRKIDHTIDLIKRREYGYCRVCGREIGIARLEARPTAELCIDCKTADELKERHLTD